MADQDRWRKASRASSIGRGVADYHPFNSGIVDLRNPTVNSSTMSRTASFARTNSVRRTSVSSNNLVASTSNAAQQVAINAEEEAKLRKELRYFFMTPCEKWRYRQKPPVKLSIQITKVVLVTMLVIVFGNQRAAYVRYNTTLQTTLEHLYLLNWNPTSETPPYPPSAGVYAVYTQDDFYATLNYALTQYNATQELETDTFQMLRNATAGLEPVKFCVSQYVESHITASNRSIRVNFNTYSWCLDVHPVAKFNQTTNTTENVFDIRELLAQKKNISGLSFEAIESVRLRMAFVSVKPPSAHFSIEPTDCYLLNATILFDNSARCGQIPISLNLHSSTIDCFQTIEIEKRTPRLFGCIISSLVIGFCICSALLCIRSLRRGYLLMRETSKHFDLVLAQPLTMSDRIEFANLWYVLVVISDVLAICGSIMKLQIDSHGSHAYDTCSIILGITTLLVWFGVLRYLTFFAGYSDLILTLQKASPGMVRYLICALTIFLGFLFCGWIVIGPYHFKMRTLSSTAECLYALLNGDDMYATFSNLSLDVASDYVSVFLRVYLYCFVAIYIYIVLAVFLSVILDVYETIKQKGTITLRQLHSENSDLFKFIYRLDDDDSIAARQLRQGRVRTRSRNESLKAQPSSTNLNASEDIRAIRPNIRERECLLNCCCCGQQSPDED